MGTDIHGVFQRLRNARWENVESAWKQDRHYQLFAVLADVRNGYGFAGLRTGEPVKPIAMPRGLPMDFTMHYDAHPSANKDPVRMGDHSHSWLTGAEMLAWAEQAPTVIKTGIISADDYKKWDKTSPPESYYGGVFGSSRRIVLPSAADREEPHTDVQIEWESPLREELAYFFDEVARLVALYGDIRLVFGFDS